jgi:hypothetical protein
MGGADPRTNNKQYLPPAQFSTDGARIIESKKSSRWAQMNTRCVAKSSSFAFGWVKSTTANTTYRCGGDYRAHPSASGPRLRRQHLIASKKQREFERRARLLVLRQGHGGGRDLSVFERSPRRPRSGKYIRKQRAVVGLRLARGIK